MNAADVFLSPAILFFILGFVAALARSDLAIPEAIAKGMSLYLMAAIGLKGGVQVSMSGFTPLFGLAAAAGVALSFLLPVGVFYALQRVGRLSRVDAGAVAAHYGSVSVITFVTGVEILSARGMPPPGFMVAVMALMETPAIVSGLLLARGVGAHSSSGSGLLRETLFNGSVVLLIGSFLIGLIAGKGGTAAISPVFETAFRGVLCLFLLDMGLLAARRIQSTNVLTVRIVVLALVLPVINALIGLGVGVMIGLDAGSIAALAILAGSASYIAVPAAMRVALPQADPGLSLSMSLAITFPFNILIGIPLYAWVVTKVTQA